MHTTGTTIVVWSEHLADGKLFFSEAYDLDGSFVLLFQSQKTWFTAIEPVFDGMPALFRWFSLIQLEEVSNEVKPLLSDYIKLAKTCGGDWGTFGQASERKTPSHQTNQYGHFIKTAELKYIGSKDSLKRPWIVASGAISELGLRRIGELARKIAESTQNPYLLLDFDRIETVKPSEIFWLTGASKLETELRYTFFVLVPRNSAICQFAGNFQVHTTRESAVTSFDKSMVRYLEEKEKSFGIGLQSRDCFECFYQRIDLDTLMIADNISQTLLICGVVGNIVTFRTIEHRRFSSEHTGSMKNGVLQLDRSKRMVGFKKTIAAYETVLEAMFNTGKIFDE